MEHGAHRIPNRRERKYRRFELEYRVILRCNMVDTPAEAEALSQNISIGGLLVKSDLAISKHTTVSFIISVQANGGGRPI